MKTIIHVLLLVLIFISCEDPTSNTNNSNPIIFQTVGNSFTTADSIHVIIKNNSDSNLLIGMRCGYLLEMSYQRKEKDVWSDNLYFLHNTYPKGCATRVDSIKAHSAFYYNILPETFDTIGTYRLILNDSIISNSFNIQ